MTDSLATLGDPSKRLTVCVIAHTHWDREWYHSASRFRQQLVALVDSLFAMPAGDAFPFLLDGQAVVLEDYLAVRPEMAARMGECLRRGDIEAGPWYVLADGLIPSGEATVRNLLAGRRVLRRFGATAPAVAYCPDTFGHSVAIPAIAQGFGFPLAIVWRGFGGARWPKGDLVRWRAASGESVLTYHLPPDGYETGSALPTERAQVAKRWTMFRELMAKRSTAGVVLLPNGADHHALQPDIRAAFDALRNVAKADDVVRESLGGFAKRIVNAVASRRDKVPVIEGELRDSYGYTWTLGGTFGTRAAQKRTNARAERLLLRDVEPWLVLAWLHGASNASTPGSDGSITLAQMPALLDTAWRTLLRAHPHDTLCGCSIDAVARAMEVRMESAVAQGHGLRSSALNVAMQRNAVAARSGPLNAVPQLVVRNRCARWRGGLAEVLLDETLGDAPVGPSSATVAVSEDDLPHSRPNVAGLPLQVVGSKLVYRRRESPQHYPDNDRVREHRALVWLPPVPPMGLAAFALRFDTDRALGSDTKEVLLGSETKNATMQDKSMSLATNRSISMGSESPKNGTDISLGSETKNAMSQDELMPPFATARVSGNEIELANGRLTVVVGPSGVRITRDGRTIQDALTFESTSDVGDSYTPAIRGEPELLQISSVTRGAAGPLRVSAVLRLRTLKKRKGVRVRATITLDVESDIVRVDITGNNERLDHRLRVNFATDIAGSASEVAVFADAAFGPAERPILNVPLHDQTRETVPPTMPMHRWVTMSASEFGATLHADGLAEAETNRTTGAISLTLLRAIGELSRADLPERRGHAGWPAPIPLAQSMGIFHARIGLQLHDGWSEATLDAIETANDSLLLPLIGETVRDLADPFTSVMGPQLEGSSLRTSAITLADDDDGIVLRCVNDSNDVRQGTWTLPPNGAFQFAHARLDETLESAWSTARNSFAFEAQPRAIVTIRVRRPIDE